MIFFQLRKEGHNYMSKKYTEEFKQSMVKRMLPPESISVTTL